MNELPDDLADVRDVLGEEFIDRLAVAAQQHNVMINISISPYVNATDEVETPRDPNDP